MGSPGGESKGSNSTQRGLHPPLPVQTQPNQITNCHKQLYQPSQKSQPFRGSVSAGEQKCSRTSSKPKLPGVLQPAIFGTQTQQPVETYLGPMVTSIDFKDAHSHIPVHSQSRKCMRPVQGRSYQFKAIPFGLSTASIEFTVVAKEVKLMALQNPPVPRRLVGESYIPPNLSPAYTDLGSSLLRSRLAGEQGKIRAGSKTGFQLRGLPVQLERGQGQTHTRTLADLDRQNPNNSVRSDSSCPS